MSDPRAAANGACAIVFPGVGITPCGAEAAWFERHRAVMEPFVAEASELAHSDLVAALEGSRWAELSPRELELFAHGYNCAVDAVYRQAGIVPTLVAGHSLGIYSAMVGAGACSYADGLRMVDEAHRLSKEAARSGDYGMGVTVGLSRDQVAGLLASVQPEALSLANSNSPTSHILSGQREVLHEVLCRAAELDALKAVDLGVQVPFHHAPALAGATAELRQVLQGLSWSTPQCPVLSTIDQRLLDQPEDLMELTALNLSTAIHWQRSVEAMAAGGIELVWESGPGVSLTQNARFIQGAPRHLSIRTAQRRLDA